MPDKNQPEDIHADPDWDHTQPIHVASLDVAEHIVREQRKRDEARERGGKHRK